MKRIAATALITALLFSGCQPTNTNDGSIAGSASLPESTSSQNTELVSTESSEATNGLSDPESMHINSALSLIPGGERLLDSSDRNLFLLKEYGLEMKWMEANQIEHLERGTPHDAVGKYDVYFLLVPKYVDSSIEVQRLEWDEKKEDVVPVETLYTISSTPDEYGLLLTSNEPEGVPNLRVTLKYASEQYSYTFYYDGRGDRPAILAFPEDEDWPSKLVASLEGDARQEFLFTNGPGGQEQMSMRIGDTFIGWTLLEAESVDYNLIARFEGSATLKGRLFLEGSDDLMGNIVQFTVSEDSRDLLPYFEHDTRELWFGFDNQEQVIAAVGKGSFDMDCEIKVQGYSIDFRPMMTMNTVAFVELIQG